MWVDWKKTMKWCICTIGSKKSLSEAKAHCNTVFRSIGRGGKIFEPVDTNTFNTVKKTAFTFSSSYYWIGFVREDGTNWKRISDGLPAPNLWGSNGNVNNSWFSSRRYMFVVTGNYWADRTEYPSSHRSICEVIWCIFKIHVWFDNHHLLIIKHETKTFLKYWPSVFTKTKNQFQILMIFCFHEKRIPNW